MGITQTDRTLLSIKRTWILCDVWRVRRWRRTELFLFLHEDPRLNISVPSPQYELRVILTRFCYGGKKIKLLVERVKTKKKKNAEKHERNSEDFWLFLDRNSDDLALFFGLIKEPVTLHKPF